MKGNKTIFSTEWRNFIKIHGFSGTAEAIEHTDELQGFINQPETIARFCSGRRPISEANIELFAKLFGVRPEYLSGKDPFRTEDDIAMNRKKEEDIARGLRIIFNNLGYVDLFTEKTDYNQTFPENTKAFIESLRDDLTKAKVNLLIDVQRNRYVPLSYENETLFINELLSFIQYKLGQLFNARSEEVPECITESGEHLLSPHNEIELTDGSILSLDLPYVPTNLLLNSSEEIDVQPKMSVKKK